MSEPLPIVPAVVDERPSHPPIRPVGSAAAALSDPRAAQGLR